MSGNAKAGIGKENAAVRTAVVVWMVVLFVVLPLVLG
jgi:hypothetical protein